MSFEGDISLNCFGKMRTGSKSTRYSRLAGPSGLPALWNSAMTSINPTMLSFMDEIKNVLEIETDDPLKVTVGVKSDPLCDELLKRL
jgi:hypothetical protein